MGGSASRMEKSIDAEIIMEFTDAEIIDALTANIAPPDAPPRHTQPPPQPPLQTGFITRPPPTAAIPEASCALRAVEVVSAWFDVPAVQAIAPNSSSVNRKRARPNRAEDATLGVTDEITREAQRRMYGNQMISTSRDGSHCEDKSFHTTCSNTSLVFPPEQLQDVAQQSQLVRVPAGLAHVPGSATAGMRTNSQLSGWVPDPGPVSVCVYLPLSDCCCISFELARQ